jgi:NAD(P)-dependent dehydrogenase (short-subunit alcohol dehydrogenase family)
MTRPCIVVTGASRGIGAAIAMALAGQGFNVACLSRSGAAPAGPAGTAAPAGEFLPIAADVTDAAAVAAAFERVAARGWTVAGLVNNAGVHIEAPSATLALAQWDDILRTNATSVLIGSQAAYPHLLKAGGGLIVNIGSFFDRMGVKRSLAYCASKAAVGAITRCLAVEWANKGIRVVDVAPGYIHTDLNHEQITSGPLHDYLARRIPGGKPGEAAEVGRFVALLFAHGGGFLSGETIYLDGAQGIAH